MLAPVKSILYNGTARLCCLLRKAKTLMKKMKRMFKSILWLVITCFGTCTYTMNDDAMYHYDDARHVQHHRGLSSKQFIYCALYGVTVSFVQYLKTPDLMCGTLPLVSCIGTNIIGGTIAGCMVGFLLDAYLIRCAPQQSARPHDNLDRIV